MFSRLASITRHITHSRSISSSSSIRTFSTTSPIPIPIPIPPLNGFHTTSSLPPLNGIHKPINGNPLPIAINHWSDIPSMNFKIVDSTLREGEQFSTAFFDTADKIYIAGTLDNIGVEYVELVTPMASEQSFKDIQILSRLGLKTKIVTHIRCHMQDAKLAIEAGVQGVNMYMATSEALRKHSHGKGIDHIIQSAKEVIDYCLQKGVECRFSCEDTFRSDMSDLLRIYTAVDSYGVHRVGLADTVGVATPLQVYQTTKTVREHVKCDIEYHTHDDTGCCIANALLAIQGGATHIDTCVLGIGERNGITPLGGFLGRMYTIDKKAIRSRYNLPLVRDLEKFVARKSHIDIPFNNYITGSAAFTHKAGVHSKAVMQNPGSYEVIDPADFGIERNIQIAHRLTGWNAVQQRTIQLGYKLSERRVKQATAWIKNLADTKGVTITDLDEKLKELNELEINENKLNDVTCEISKQKVNA